MVKGILFDRGIGHLKSATGLPVWHGDDTYHIVSGLADSIQRGDCKVGGSHKDYFHIEGCLL